MNRTPDQFAPSWLPRQQRRRIDHQLRKLFHHDVCSVCGGRFKHNSRTAGGLDTQGNVVLAGECCLGRVAKIFARGFYSNRNYDFLLPTTAEPSTNTEPTTEPTSDEQIADAIAAYQKAIAVTDKELDGVERRGGSTRAPHVTVRNYPWKDDDRDWFECNQKRSHRVRMPFPGEVDKEAVETPAGQVLIMLVRQVEPGFRLRAAVNLDADWLPVPDDEAVAYALFEIAMRREAVPPDGEALRALLEKYKAQEPGQ